MTHLKEEEIVYFIGKVLLLLLVPAGIWFYFQGYELLGGLLTCGIRKRFGVICPGCGGTRAVFHLLHGDFIKSLLFHPVVCVMAASYIHFMLRCFVRKHSTYGGRSVLHWERYIFLAMIVTIAQWLVKLFIMIMVPL